ncbi:MAG: C45 family autoproteolytic acyltransferase/hydrolase [Propionibacteriaceae bacterium]
MRVTELRLPQRDPVERGRAYGTALAGEVRHTIELYREAYAAMGVPGAVITEVVDASLDLVRDWAPIQWDELSGIAAAAGVSLPELMMLTARTEILAHAPGDALECSTVVALHPDRRPQTLQTWDWHGELAPTGVLLEANVDGRIVRTFTEIGMVGKIGVTAGLGVHFNILHHRSDRSEFGVPVHVVMRRILDEASSLDDAVGIAKDATVGASTVLTVVEAGSADGPARAASLELAPAGVAVVEPVDGLLVHTNHFLDPGLAAGEATSDTSTTGVRLDHAAGQRVDLVTATDTITTAQALCGGAGAEAPVCVRAKPAAALADRWETLLTIGLDIETAKIDWYPGPPSGLDAATVRRFG